MADAVTRADKVVKIGLAVAKLVGGNARAEALGEIMKVATNGRDLLADLRPDEQDIGHRLRAASEASLARLDGNPDFPPEALHEAQARMTEAWGISEMWKWRSSTRPGLRRIWTGRKGVCQRRWRSSRLATPASMWPWRRGICGRSPSGREGVDARASG